MERRHVVAIGAAAGSFLLIAWVTAADRVTFWEDLGSDGASRPTPRAQPEVVEPSRTLPELVEGDSEPLDLSFLRAIGAVLLVAAVIYVAVMLFMVLRRRWLRRAEMTSGVAAEFEALPDLAETLAAATSDPDQLLRDGSPRNAIVSCWIRLCDGVEDAGLQPDAAETSSELTERVIGAYVVDRRAIVTLAALYREARFSDHDLTESDRQRAIDALAALDEQLRRRRTAEEPTS